MIGQHCVPYHCHLFGGSRSHDLKKQKLQGIINLLPILMFIQFSKTIFSPSDVTLIVDSKNIYIHRYGYRIFGWCLLLWKKHAGLTLITARSIVHYFMKRGMNVFYITRVCLCCLNNTQIANRRWFNVVVKVSIGCQSNFDVESTFTIRLEHQNVILPKRKHRFSVDSMSVCHLGILILWKWKEAVLCFSLYHISFYCGYTLQWW